VIERLVDALRRSGDVRDFSIYVTESRRLALGIKDREAGNAHAPLSLSESCGARYLVVWRDARVSRGYLERRQLEADPTETLELARAAVYDDPDAAWVLGPAPLPDVALHDDAVARLARGEVGPIAGRLAEIRRRLDGAEFRTWSGSFSAAEARARLVTSAGLDVTGRGTATGWHVTLDGEVGDGFGARRTEPDDEFRARLERLAATARRLQHDAPPLPAGMRPVLLHPRVVRDYALDTLWTHLDGATVDHREGRFRREDFGSGRAVLREDLQLRIDPLLPYRNGSYRFTGEGLPAARCSFIENGCLIRPVLDLKYARRLGLPPTPVPYASDVVHFGGARRLDLDAALERADGGALVLSVLGVHTQDGSSGDFSLSAPQTLAIDAGRLGGRLRATLSGNLFALLRDDALEFVAFPGEPIPGLLVRCRLDPR